MITKIQNTSIYTAKPAFGTKPQASRNSIAVSFGYNAEESLEMGKETIQALSNVFDLLKQEDKKISKQLTKSLTNFIKSKNNVKVLFNNNIPRQLVKLFMKSDDLNIEFGKVNFGSHLYKLDVNYKNKNDFQHNFQAFFEDDSRFMSVRKGYKSVTNHDSSTDPRAVDKEAYYHLTELLEHYSKK